MFEATCIPNSAPDTQVIMKTWSMTGREKQDASLRSSCSRRLINVDICTICQILEEFLVMNHLKHFFFHLDS